MDLLLVGIVIGVALAGIVYFGVHTAKKSRQTSIRNAQTNAATYRALQSRLDQAISKDEFCKLQNDIELQVSQLDDEAYKSLMTNVEYMIREIVQKEDERAETLPKLQKFSELRHRVYDHDLFDELHRIYFEADGIITYDLLDEYGEKSDIEWFKKTYDWLLIVQMQALLMATRSGAVDDYQQVMLLWDELEDFVGFDGSDRKRFFAKHFVNEWNEMVARFMPESEWYDTMLGLGDLNSDDYRGIIRKAYDDDDFLSQCLVLWFAKDDVEFQDVLLETFLQKLRTVQELHIGFKPTH